MDWINRKNLIYLVLLASVVGFFIMSFLSNPAYDDFNYHFKYDSHGLTNERVQNLSDIVSSQYHHYFTFNGRVVVHSFVQFFLMHDSKIWFDLANSVVFCFFLILILLNASIEPFDKKNLPLFLVLILSVWFVLSGLNYCFMWLSGSVNYLWSVTAALLLVQIYRGRSGVQSQSLFILTTLFFTAFVLSAMHEVISIALFIAFAFDYLWNKRFRSYAALCILIGTFLGAVFVSTSPANFVRAAIVSQNVNNNFQAVVASNDSHIFILLNSIKIFILLVALLFILWIRNKAYFGVFLRKNMIFLVAIVASLSFIWYVKGFNQRAIFPAAVFALIVVLNAIKELQPYFSTRFATLVLVLGIGAMVFEYSKVYTELRHNRKAYENFLCSVKESDDKVTLFASPELIKNRFVCFTGFGASDRTMVPNMGLSRLFHKPYFVFFPQPICSAIERLDSISDVGTSKSISVCFPSSSLIFVKIPHQLDSGQLENGRFGFCLNEDNTQVAHSLSFCRMKNYSYVFFRVTNLIHQKRVGKLSLTRYLNKKPIEINVYR